jgi:hypothetical protein
MPAAEQPISGQFSVESIALVNQHQQSIDIRDLVQEFRLNESIHNKFCSATFAIADGIDLIKNFKMTGQEFIRISIKQKEGTPEEPIADAVSENSIDKTFRIFKIDNLKQDVRNAPMQMYLIRCVEPRLYTCRRTRLSRVFRGSYDDILENIFVNHAKIAIEEFDHWEETLPDNIQFIAPNWTVGSVIDHCLNHASKGNDSVWRNGMFFYQTLNGGFRLKSIDQMFQDEFPVTFSMYPRNAADVVGLDLNAPGGLNSQIISMEKPQIFDTLQGTVGGAYASKLEAYDPVRKLSEDASYDIEETFKRQSDKHLSKFPMLHIDKGKGEFFLTTENQTDPMIPPKITELDNDLAPNEYNHDQREALVVNTYSMNHSWDNASDITVDPLHRGVESKDNSRLERIALLETLEQNRCIITIPLRTDLSVGTIIKLEVPPQQPSVEGHKHTDQLNDNRYLITDIAVHAQPQKHRGHMVLECSKESYKKEPAKVEDYKVPVTEEI